MAFQWINKIDGVDIQSADDVNTLAAGIIQNESDISAVQKYVENQEQSISKLSGRVGTVEGQASNALSQANNVNNRLDNTYTKSEVEQYVSDSIQSAIFDSWNEVTAPYEVLGVSE